MNTQYIKNKLFYISIVLMFLLPAFPTDLKSKIIIVIVFFLVINIPKNQFNFKRFLFNSSIYLFIVISVLYSENLDYAIKKLQTMSSLVVFPFAFSIISLDKVKTLYKDKERYMFIYVLVITAINLIFFAYHFGHYKSSLLTHYITVTRSFQGGYNIHPIYLSMHISVSIIFTFFLINKEKNKKRLAFLFVLDIILISFLLILLKKGPILGLGIGYTLFVILQNKKKLWIFYTSTVFIVLITIMSLPKLQTKFTELFEIESIESGNLTSTNIRYSIYDYAIKTIKKAPIIGHGIGDFKDQLVESYKDSPILFKSRFNAHNQYLSFATSIGLLGLSLFIIVLAFNFINGLKYNNYELIIILVFYSFVMASENILEREDGVVFFSLFAGFFGLFSNRKLTQK